MTALRRKSPSLRGMLLRQYIKGRTDDMIFEEMKSTSRKEAFLAKRSASIGGSAGEVESMAAYILTERFDENLQRLIEGDYYFDPPKLICRERK